ncbi:pyridine nucleotide-disulfide oxidoreductase [Micromonospora globispora]|uniref:Pyridine nucleotide-disulfide oxidoreductase n=1 Tax=Micromonospora globispora TaxID=1450148 RepID=A0A317JTX8_9ACTN|nr:FAD-dependent oxidoreductase [Micromonospora globispora]PWU44169.1 pyridine nucleotide-disulfide oxidoreductase [Micromonospora globispora]PWU60142.1 pyridine nucleotide-disulfide oxidoreductase [Micromonospora globispora]RQW96119.1 pyridine nucleotide-disulfide oxidoreductase [Micromonospora globispora]
MSTPIQRVVVVGNGIAGLTAADTLRNVGFDGKLTIVGDETHAAYSRPALSKALLLDGDDMSSHELPPTTHGATELLGVRATGLDVDRRLVTLDDGAALPYDRVVLATGSRARRLSDLPEELTLRGLDDALALRKRLAGRPSVVVVGGGPLGMEIASGCLTAGCQVTLVSQGVPLILQLGPYLAEVFGKAALERGLTIVETGSARLDRRGGEAQVVLDDGVVLEAELVVTAVGDVPNMEWLADTGLADQGVVQVDSRGLVRPEIAAVGDLAAFPTPYGLRRIPLWSSAVEQAKVAAAALVRGDDTPPLQFQPYFWTEQFGLSLKAVGYLPLDGEPTYVEGGPGGPALMRWSHDDGSGAAVALNHRIPIPRLRRVSQMAG